VIESQTSWLVSARHGFLAGVGFVDHCEVLVVGDRIAWVGYDGSTDPRPDVSSATAATFAGGTILPGLIDAHVHLTFSGLSDTVDVLRAEDDLDSTVRALGNAQRALRYGVTTQVDCGSRGTAIARLRDSILAGLATGPRILTAGPPLTTTAGHCHWLGGHADTVDEVIRGARSRVADGSDVVKLMLTGGNMTAGSNPGALQYPVATMYALGAEAIRLGKPLVVHAHSTEAVRAAAEGGATVIAHATCLADGRYEVDDATLAVLLASGSFVDPTLTVGIAREGADDRTVARSRVRQSMIPVYQRMHAAGVPLLAGTDGGSTHVEHHAVARAVSALHHEVGLTVEEALHSATDQPATAYGLRGQTGALEPGLAADLIVVKGDVRSDVSSLAEPLAVWARGRLVHGVRDHREGAIA